MKLLIVVSTLNTGGAQKIVSQITTNFPREWEIDILLNSDDNIQFPYRGNIISLNKKTEEALMGLRYHLDILIKRFLKLRELKRTGNYDLCISFLDSANVANILTGNRYCRTMVTVVNNMVVTAQNNIYYRLIVNPLIKLLYNRADKISALSVDVMNQMISDYGLDKKKIVPLYCSIDVNEIHDIINNFDVPDVEKEWFNKEYTVVAAGRYAKQKGQWHLIRAFSEVLKVIPQAKLVIFGEGVLKPYFEQLIEEYDMAESVLLHPFDDKLVGYISKSAVFVMPSLFEGFGTALQEALACNVACIATDYSSGGKEQLDPTYCGKIIGVHKGKYGLLTPSVSSLMPHSDMQLEESEKNISEAIVYLLKNQELRDTYANVSEERAFDFDIGSIVKEWIKVVEA